MPPSLPTLIYVSINSLKPLVEQSDSFLIRKVKNEACSEAFNEICRRYENIFYKQCQKYAASLSACGIFLQDIFNEKNIIILHCIRTFKPSKKTKLSSWIGNYARYLCLNSMNAKRIALPAPNTEVQQYIEEQQICDEYFQNKTNPEDSRNYIFDLLNQMKDKRIKTIFEYRYFHPKKMIWQKIAKKMRTSPQTVMALHRKGISLIKNKITSDENVCDLV